MSKKNLYLLVEHVKQRSQKVGKLSRFGDGAVRVGVKLSVF